MALQKLAGETGMVVSVCQFPPGTSKWNKIEHRVFCRITESWRAPRVSHEVISNLIGNTTTAKGLKIQAELDGQTYPTDIQVADEDLEKLRIGKGDCHGEWNYQISPHPK